MKTPRPTMFSYAPSAQTLRSLRAFSRPFLCRKCARRRQHHASIPQIYPSKRSDWHRRSIKKPGSSKDLSSSCRGAYNSASPGSVAELSLCAPPTQEKRGETVGKTNEKPYARSEKWDLTVGIEVHAELATTSKLFSPAATSLAASPNTHTSVFDTAFPGAQPRLQRQVLLPAIRAALALNCEIREQSGWDRKHYFWWDQPQGYQITQYYSPFAKNGSLTLYPWDDIDPTDITNDNGEIQIGIKQVQMEQDTAKTVLQPPNTYLLDFNRAGTPLIEVITRPEIKSPKTAATVVRKIQALLQSVGANTTGMEMGGLRADVNVSVRLKGDRLGTGTFEYDGISGLGQRTEIKNLSSVKAVEDAVMAERDRQIDALESGGIIEGETRRWSLGASTTRRLRGKEGEVDYRYMPDPDLGSLRIGSDLIEYLTTFLPRTPDGWVKTLTNISGSDDHGLSMKDAKTLVALDNGERLEFYHTTLEILRQKLKKREAGHVVDVLRTSQVVGNWVLMEIPTFLAPTESAFPYYYSANPYPSRDSPKSSESKHPPTLGSHVLSEIICQYLVGSITQQSARRMLELCRLPSSDDEALALSDEDDTKVRGAVESLIDAHGFRFQPLGTSEYSNLVEDVLRSNVDMADKARAELRNGDGKKRGKMMWFVGQIVRRGEKGRVEAKVVEQYVYDALMRPSS